MKKSTLFKSRNLWMAMAVAYALFSCANTCSAGVFGTSGYIAFHFINGDGLAENNTLKTFTMDVIGGSRIDNPLDPQVDKDAPNFEHLIEVVYGSSIDFEFILSNFVEPGADVDSFVMYLLDSSLNPIVDTNGAGALFQFDLDGNTGSLGNLTTFDNSMTKNNDVSWSFFNVPSFGEPGISFVGSVNTGGPPSSPPPSSNPVPEPTAISMWAFGAMAMGLVLRRRRNQQ